MVFADAKIKLWFVCDLSEPMMREQRKSWTRRRACGHACATGRLHARSARRLSPRLPPSFQSPRHRIGPQRVQTPGVRGQALLYTVYCALYVCVSGVAAAAQRRPRGHHQAWSVCLSVCVCWVGLLMCQNKKGWYKKRG